MVKGVPHLLVRSWRKVFILLFNKRQEHVRLLVAGVKFLGNKIVEDFLVVGFLSWLKGDAGGRDWPEEVLRRLLKCGNGRTDGDFWAQVGLSLLLHRLLRRVVD